MVTRKQGAVKWALQVRQSFGPGWEIPAKPIAYTDVEGRFSMTTDRSGDGVASGEYAVTVEWREKSRSGVEKIRGRNLLPVRYAKPESSGLHCRVQEGQNELPPLNLTDK